MFAVFGKSLKREYEKSFNRFGVKIKDKRLPADARNFKTRLLAQIPMTVSDGLKKGNRNE